LQGQEELGHGVWYTSLHVKRSPLNIEEVDEVRIPVSDSVENSVFLFSTQLQKKYQLIQLYRNEKNSAMVYGTPPLFMGT
jgi:hypothetical protein